MTEEKLTERQKRIRAAETQLETIATKRAEVLEERKLVMLETRIKYEQEIGPGGEAFQLLDANEHGPIVLAPPETGGLALLYKAYSAAIAEEKKRTNNPHGGYTEAAALRFVGPCVRFPEVVRFREICEAAPGVLVECAGALIALCNARAEVDAGK